MKKPSILVVGSMNMDFLIYGVPGIAEYGETLFCQRYGYAPGGKGANQSIAVARLGGDSAMVGRLGDDRNGRILLKNLEKNGVDTKDIVMDPGSQTGLANILVDHATGQYTCYLVMGGNALISAKQVEAALARRHYDMVLMQLEMPLDTVYQTYEMAAKKNIPVFLDAGPAVKISLERFRGVFVLSPNEAETKALAGIEPASEETALEAAKILYEAASPQYVLLKLGKRGAMLYDGRAAQWFPCYGELQAVDSTAAGDTFGAAFAVRYCMGSSVGEAIQYAHAAAGICVTRKGAQDSIPYSDEVEQFLTNKNNTRH